MSVIEKPNRTFLSSELSFTWENLKPYFDNLLSREIESKADLMQWLNDFEVN